LSNPPSLFLAEELARREHRPCGVLGGGTLYHLDAERAIVEIGYFVLPHARGRRVRDSETASMRHRRS
jgi:hypothetical protein